MARAEGGGCVMTSDEAKARLMHGWHAANKSLRDAMDTEWDAMLGAKDDLPSAEDGPRDRIMGVEEVDELLGFGDDDSLDDLFAEWIRMASDPPPPKPTVADALISWHRSKKRGR